MSEGDRDRREASARACRCSAPTARGRRTTGSPSVMRAPSRQPPTRKPSDPADRRQPQPGEAVEDDREDVHDRVDREPHTGHEHDQHGVGVPVGVDPLADVVDPMERSARRCRAGSSTGPRTRRRVTAPTAARRTARGDCAAAAGSTAPSAAVAALTSGVPAADRRQDLGPIDDAHEPPAVDDADRLLGRMAVGTAERMIVSGEAPGRPTGRRDGRRASPSAG